MKGVRKMKWILKNKNHNTYLKYYKRIKLKHYVADINDASIFTKTEAKRMLEKFKHPENWEIVPSDKKEN